MCLVFLYFAVGLVSVIFVSDLLVVYSSVTRSDDGKNKKSHSCQFKACI